MAAAAVAAPAIASPPSSDGNHDEVPLTFLQYQEESQLPFITNLMADNLSEPYSVFTYRYFLNNWPQLCFLAMTEDGRCVGTIVCKMEMDRDRQRRGYIAMLAVEKSFRKRKIGSQLVEMAIEAMLKDGVDLVVLEAEVTNHGAIALYEKLNFVREQRLLKYYLSGQDAFRLKLWIRDNPAAEQPMSLPQLEE